MIFCSSFSRSLAPGLRVGWVTPGRYAGRVMHWKIKEFTFIRGYYFPSPWLSQMGNQD